METSSKKDNVFVFIGRKCCSFLHYLNQKSSFRSFISGLICVLIGLFVGFILMLCVYPQGCLQGLWSLVSSGFKSKETFAEVIYKATPMSLAGVAIAFAFKLGLFNIGITGQVTAGAFASICVGLAGGNWFVCLLVGCICGGIAGFIPGFLKAKFNVNEVLSGIMLNWVIYYVIGIIGNLGLPSSFKYKMSPSELNTLPKVARMPAMGLENSLPGVSVGIIIAVIIIIFISILLNRTTFGFELKMTGSNKHASRYAGVNQTKSIILALTISGALAGICGYMSFADPVSPIRFTWDSNSNSLLSNGFNGISVSLIAQNSPIGCILSAILLNLIDASQNSLKTVSNMYNSHYTELIKSIIIYVAALSSFTNMIIKKYSDKNNNKDFFNDLSIYKKQLDQVSVATISKEDK